MTSWQFSGNSKIGASGDGPRIRGNFPGPFGKRIAAFLAMAITSRLVIFLPQNFKRCRSTFD